MSLIFDDVFRIRWVPKTVFCAQGQKGHHLISGHYVDPITYAEKFERAYRRAYNIPGGRVGGNVVDDETTISRRIAIYLVCRRLYWTDPDRASPQTLRALHNAENRAKLTDLLEILRGSVIEIG